jgi:hypothetical protein
MTLPYSTGVIGYGINTRGYSTGAARELATLVEGAHHLKGRAGKNTGRSATM